MFRTICQRIGVVLSQKAVLSAGNHPNEIMGRACRLILPLLEFCQEKKEAIAEGFFNDILGHAPPQLVRRANSLQGSYTGISDDKYTKLWTSKVSTLLLSNHNQEARRMMITRAIPAVWAEIQTGNVVLDAESIQRLAEITYENADIVTDGRVFNGSIPIASLKENIGAAYELIASGGYPLEENGQPSEGMIRALNALVHKVFGVVKSGDCCEGRDCFGADGEEDRD